MNSVLYDYCLQSPDGDVLIPKSWEHGIALKNAGYKHIWVERKYVNMGLLYGYNRSSSESEVLDLGGELGVKHKELHRMCPSEIWSDVHSLFLKKHLATLNLYPHIPWYIPEWLGGRGLVPPEDHVYTNRDLHGAAVIRYNYAAKKPKLSFDPKTWFCYDLVVDQVKQTGLSDCEHTFITVDDANHPVRDGCQEVLNWMLIGLLFSTTKKDLFSKKPELSKLSSFVHKAFEFNQRLWCKAVKKEADIKPMLAEELLRISYKDSIPVFCKATCPFN